jgi:WD40 repeat protein
MIRQRYCFCILCLILGLSAALAVLFLLNPEPAHAQAKGKAKADPAKGGPISFINDIAPIFKENCFACHDAKKRKGKLDMTTYENLRKGGENDDPISVGKPEDSLLHQLITTKTARRMPPKESGDPLPPDKIALIDRWIKDGAKLDQGIDAKADLMRELRIRWKPPAAPTVYKFPVIVNAVAFTPDSQKVIVGGHHELTVWDVNEGKLEKRLSTRTERAYGLGFLPDGKLVVAGGRPGQEGSVRVYDINAGTPKVENGVAFIDGVNDSKVFLKELADSDDAILCLAISPDGKRLATGGCDRIVRVWDISGGFDNIKLDQTCENHADWVFGIALSPDGKYMLTCGRDKTAKVWDLNAKESVATFPGHQATVYGVAVRADGKVGYSVGEDKQVRAWNVGDNAKPVSAGTGHGDSILKLAPHPKQPMLVTASADKTVRTWNAGATVAAGKTLSGHTDQVFAIAVSPDGELIASGSYNGEVRIWKMDGSLVKSFHASPGYTPAAAAAEKK